MVVLSGDRDIDCQRLTDDVALRVPDALLESGSAAVDERRGVLDPESVDVVDLASCVMLPLEVQDWVVAAEELTVPEALDGWADRVARSDRVPEAPNESVRETVPCPVNDALSLRLYEGKHDGDSVAVDDIVGVGGGVRVADRVDVDDALRARLGEAVMLALVSLDRV